VCCGRGRLSRTNADGLRRASVLAGRRRALTETSRLFDLLVAADARDDGQRSWRYLKAAIGLGHTVAALDLHTSRDELDAIERFRRVLLEGMTSSGVLPPSQRQPDGGFFAAGPPTQASRPTRPAHTSRPPSPTSTPPSSAIDELMDLQAGPAPTPPPRRQAPAPARPAPAPTTNPTTTRRPATSRRCWASSSRSSASPR
jgi:hypothetical protein